MLSKILFFACLAGRGLSFSKIYLFHLFLIPAGIKEFRLLTFKKFLVNEKPLIFMLLFSSLSLLWSTNLGRGAQDVIYLLIGISIIYTLSNSKLPKEEFLKVLALFSWINLSFSVLETLNLFRYPISNYSEYATFFGVPASNVGEGISIPTGFFVNPNDNALFILMFTPILVSYLRKIPGLVYILISTYVVFMASSKLILVGWICLLMILAYRSIYRKYGLLKSTLIFVVFLSFGAGMFALSNGQRIQKYSKTVPAIKTFLIMAPKNFFSRLSGHEVKFDFSKFDISLHERLVYTDGLATALQKHFLIGVGAGSLHDLSAEQGGVKLSLRYPHFYLLETAAKYGLIFLCVYLYWLATTVRKAYKLNAFYALSMVLFILFSPVIGSAVYFIPKWALYGLTLKLNNEGEAS